MRRKNECDREANEVRKGSVVVCAGSSQLVFDAEFRVVNFQLLALLSSSWQALLEISVICYEAGLLAPDLIAWNFVFASSIH
jgi:hypothetical protein